MPENRWMTGPQRPWLALALCLLLTLPLAACGKKGTPVWRDASGQPVVAPSMPH